MPKDVSLCCLGQHNTQGLSLVSIAIRNEGNLPVNIYSYLKYISLAIFAVSMYPLYSIVSAPTFHRAVYLTVKFTICTAWCATEAIQSENRNDLTANLQL